MSDVIIRYISEYRDDIYGWTGSMTVLTAYTLTTFKIDELMLIDILNIYGSLSIGYICYKKRVWQAFILEVAWFGISIYSFIDRV